MGDLVRDAFQASGIDEEMEKVIADAILQRWNDCTSCQLPRTHDESRADAADCASGNKLTSAKMRLLAEQLWRRLERKYEAKLQAWKRNEERQLDEMVHRLRDEYRKNVEAKDAEFSELIERKEEEFSRKEERLKEENRLQFEKRHLEMEKAWRDVEAAKRDIRIMKDQLDASRANFALKIENELARTRRESDSLDRQREEFEEKERRLEERVQNAVRDAERRERNWIADKVNEWNAREAKLTQKCESLCERVRQSATDQSALRELTCRLKILEADNAVLLEKLAASEAALAESHRILPTLRDYEAVKAENAKLKAERENDVASERLRAKEAEVENLKKRLNLVDEAAKLRVRELKLRLRTSNDKLQKAQTESHRHRHHEVSEGEPSGRDDSRHGGHRRIALEKSTTSSSESGTLSISGNAYASMDRSLRNRLVNLDHLSHKLDMSLERYRVERDAPLRGAKPLFSRTVLQPTTEGQRFNSGISPRASSPRVLQKEENSLSESSGEGKVKEATTPGNLGMSQVIPSLKPSTMEAGTSKLEAPVAAPVKDAFEEALQRRAAEKRTVVDALATPAVTSEEKQTSTVTVVGRVADEAMQQYVEMVRAQRDGENAAAARAQETSSENVAAAEERRNSPEEYVFESLDAAAESDFEW